MACTQDLFTAGTDTTSSTVEWALAELIRHPDVLAKAQEELDAVVGRGRLVAESDLPRLTYLTAVIKEVFRLHPSTPLSLPRVAADQSHQGTHVAGGLSQARPGDLLTFGSPAHHIGIYVGDGKMIEAPRPGLSVRIAPVYPTPTDIRRVLPAGDGSVGTTATAAAVTASLSLGGAPRSPLTVGSTLPPPSLLPVMRPG